MLLGMHRSPSVKGGRCGEAVRFGGVAGNCGADLAALEQVAEGTADNHPSRAVNLITLRECVCPRKVSAQSAVGRFHRRELARQQNLSGRCNRCTGGVSLRRLPAEGGVFRVETPLNLIHVETRGSMSSRCQLRVMSMNTFFPATS